MSITYTPTTNFGSKDSLPSNDPNKVIRGAEFTTEFTAIQSAFGLAAPASNPTFTGTATFDNVTASTVSLGSVTASSLTVNGAFTSPGIDDNATSKALLLNTNDNVSINTWPASPYDRLHVELEDGEGLMLGTREKDGSYYFGMKQNATQWNNAGWIRWDQSSNTNNMTLNSGGGDFAFITQNQSYKEAMRITSTGKVGIGQTNPAHILDLKDSTPIINMEHAAGGGSRIYFDDTTDGAWGAINANYGSGGSDKKISIAPNSGIGDSRYGGMSVKKDVVQVGGDFQQTRLEVNDNIKVTGSGKQITVDDTGTNNVSAYMTAASTIGGFVASRDAPNNSEVRLEAKGNVGSLQMTGLSGLSTEIQSTSSGHLAFNMDGTQRALLTQAGTFSAEKFVANNNVVVESTYPAIDMIDTDATLGLGARMVASSDTFLLSTLNPAGSYVQDIYRVVMNANGPTQHNWTTESRGIAMSLSNGGTLGLGVTAPNAGGLMEIQANSNNGKSGSGLLMLTNTESAIASMTFNTTGNDYSIGSSGANLFNVYDVTNNTTPFAIDPDTPSGTIRLKSSGNVGIGTVSPSHKLSVEGVPTTTGAPQVAISAGVGDVDGVLAFPLAGESKGSIIANKPITFHTGALTNTTNERMRIDVQGNVGIGTDAPATQLDVQTGVVDSEVLGLRGFYADRGLSVSVLTDSVSGTSDAIVDFNNEQAANGAFTWSFEGDEKVRIDGDGNVGIGTDAPQTTLHVEQTTDAASDGFRLSRSNSNASYSQWIDGNSNWNIGYSNPSTADPTTPSISILTSGDVGINQASPQRPLHVSSVMRLEPRATVPSNPSAGDIYFSSVSGGDGGVLRCYDGAAWQDCF